MKKLLNLIVTLCALAAAVVLWLSAGTPFLKLLAGPAPLEEGQDLGQMEGEYLLYDAAYPVASYVEEYYSGDPDRVRKTGYVVYDVKRDVFVYIVVTDGNGTDLKNLMRNLQLMKELRENKDMSPVTVRGSLEVLDQSRQEHIAAALAESEIVELYEDYGDRQTSEGYYDAYFGDEYGKVLEAMCRKLNQGWEQTEWYSINPGSIGGLAVYEIWISILAAVLNLLIFLFRLISLFTGGKKGKKALPDTAGKWDRFLEAQREWVEEWCDYSLNRVRRMAYLTAVGGTVILVVIGILVKTPVQGILALHLPLGVLLGEAAAALLWCAQKGQSKPDKILKKIRKHLEKAFSSGEERERLAEDILNTEQEWVVREMKKDSMVYGILGSHYWVVFTGNGGAVAIDSERLSKVETETISGTVRSGKVRVSYLSYAIRFYYRDMEPKKACAGAVSCQIQDTQGRFMLLVRKRVGDTVEIRAV